MKKIIISILLLYIASLSMMGQNTITRKKKTDTNTEHKQTPNAHQKTELKQLSSSNPKTSNTQKVPKPATNIVNGHEWVDLGLSVKWATCNVGANNPSEYGDYYAWGETMTKSLYDWSNYFDSLDNSGDIFGTYKVAGQRITPTSGHDTARENWGGSWRMPTDAEYDELCNKCKWILTTIDCHNGYIIIGPNGNSIFLPASGWCDNSNSHSVGECGKYWSSTLASYPSGAYNLEFNSIIHTAYNSISRRYGQSIRPVTD